MANVDEHWPGGFCWIELATSDQDAAKSFYSSLFGWAQAMPRKP
jgi:predicted enzyme related to lactoylglutathione lyase